MSWKKKNSGWCRDWVYSNMTPSELKVLLTNWDRTGVRGQLTLKPYECLALML